MAETVGNICMTNGRQDEFICMKQRTDARMYTLKVLGLQGKVTLLLCNSYSSYITLSCNS